MSAAGDADDNCRPQRAQVWQVMLNEGIDAVIIEPDRVQHAAGRFDGAPRCVARARLARDRLGQDGAQPIEVDESGHFAGVAERTGRDHDRVRQPQASQLNLQVDVRGIHNLLVRSESGRGAGRAAFRIRALIQHTFHAQQVEALSSIWSHSISDR